MIFNVLEVKRDDTRRKVQRRIQKVFTDDNKVKACGRDECRKLIEVAKEVDSKTYYGDIYTGLMNIDNMIKLHERLMDK